MQKYKHTEAFCLMNYRCEKCGYTELIWNSRDGVVPYIVKCSKCKGSASHVNWGMDKRVPNYRVSPGERYFIDMTFDELVDICRKRLDRFYNTEKVLGPEEKEKKAIELANWEYYDGIPTIKEMKKIATIPERKKLIIMMPLVSNVPDGKPSWKIIKCPICGAKCWERPEQKILEAAGAGSVCTMCALKEYSRGENTNDERDRRIKREN